MRIFPAIDIRGGKVVRLTEGDYDRMTVYAESPTAVAQQFVTQGASYLHVVDLDGARDGRPVNGGEIKKLAQIPELFVQVGGGIRTEERIEAYLEAGVNRVILGTIAVQDFAFVERAAQRYGAAIAVGVDARQGKVAVSGWQEVTTLDSVAFCQKLLDAGVQTVIYTDISKDGMLNGTNLAIYETLSEIKGLQIIASGGISFEHEISALTELGIYGAIVGKAVYTGKLDLKRVLSLAKEEGAK